MNNESKSKSNNLQNFKSMSYKTSEKEKNLNPSYIDCAEKKNEGCNDWTSVPRTYDKEESCHKHEKTSTNNQWCSCNK
jgi:hypothetical protein